MQASVEEISFLLHAWCEENRTVLDKLLPLVYDELHRLAHNYMRREHGRQFFERALAFDPRSRPASALQLFSDFKTSLQLQT